jgi:pimeloyl-ACP methyl ester carboxylesterase
MHEPCSPPAGTAIFLNGYFFADRVGPCRLFVNLARTLSRLGLRSIRFDYRGRGESDGDFDTTTFESAIHDTEIVALHHSIGPMTILAHSMGCNVATAFAVKAAKPLTKPSLMVLISPHTSVSHHSPRLFSEEQIAMLETIGVVERKGATCYSTFLEPVLKGTIYKDAAKIKSRVLMLQGTNDELYSLETFRNLASRFESATTIKIDGADHNFTSTAHQAELATSICQWLKAPENFDGTAR